MPLITQKSDKIVKSSNLILFFNILCQILKFKYWMLGPQMLRLASFCVKKSPP